MKILLLGEFSALHKFLKEGLLKLGGHEVTLIANGDGWKKIPGADFSFPVRDGAMLTHLMSFFSAYYDMINKLDKFDVVQYINASFCSIYMQKIFTNKIKDIAKCQSLLCAGVDYEDVKIYKRNVFRHSPFDYDKTMLSHYNKYSIKSLMRVYNEKAVANQCDIIIPVSYGYSLGYTGGNMYKIIPFPINLDGLSYTSNLVRGKVVFFHGYRGPWKGSHFIEEAFARLQRKYPNDVETIVNKQMPYEEYIRAMRKSNVILDQCTSNGYGINACLSMAQGKITMAGNDPTQRPSIDSTFCPIVHVEPNVEQIYSQLVYLLDNRKNFEQWGYESRKYVETYHECKMIAQKYVDAWKSTGKI